MTGQDIAEAIEALSKSIGVASEKIIPYYTSWYVWKSIGFMLLAICIFIASIGVFRMFQKEGRKDEYNREVWITLSWVLVILATIISIAVFFTQFGDLFAPTGKAIHLLISDIRG